MKLDVAAVNVNVNVNAGLDVDDVDSDRDGTGRGASTSRGGMRAPLVVFASLLGSTLGLTLGVMSAGSALALDGIDLSVAAEPTAAGECPRLIQIKYPFLNCHDGEIGLADGDATWENSRRIPIGSEFVEGNGYWGDDLNSD